MSNHQTHLPEEFLSQVFELVTPQDILQCLFVCRAWKTQAQRQYYKEINLPRFSSVSLFIKAMQTCPGSFVKRITFTCKDFQSEQHSLAFKQQIHQIAVLCPNIEWLGCSPQLTKCLLQALCSLSKPLKKLGVFPYVPLPEFTACSLYHSRSVKEYAVMDGFERPHIVELIKFPRLEKLSLVNGRIPTLRDLEGILRICQNLEYLSVRLLHKKEDDKYRPFDGETEQEMEARLANPQSMVHYPAMRRLMIRSQDKVADLALFIPFLRKFNQLEKLELETMDVHTPQTNQLEGLGTLINLIHALPSAIFSIVGKRCIGTRAIALDYLRFFYQPGKPWTPTTLSIADVEFDEEFMPGALQYSASNAKDYTLTILLPKLGTTIQNIQDEYISTFAPYVNTLSIDFEYSNIKKKACEQFVHTVLTQCTQLKTLAIVGGKCYSIVPGTTSATLQKLEIIACDTPPKFIQSITAACVNLRYLTLANIGWYDINKISMPKVELEQLDIGVRELRMVCSGIILNIVTAKGSKFCHIDFAKQTAIVKQKPVRKWQVIKLKFKKIEQLRILQMSENIPIDLDLQ
jgi:hypothetical protein